MHTLTSVSVRTAWARPQDLDMESHIRDWEVSTAARYPSPSRRLVVDEGEAHMQARPIIGDVPAHIGLAKKRMAPPTVPNAPAAPIERIWETSQHVRFPTIKTTVPGNASRMPMEEADWPVPRRMVTQSEALH